MKNCNIGKSCGSACVNSQYICQKDLAQVAQGIITKLREEKLDNDQRRRAEIDKIIATNESSDAKSIESSYKALRAVLAKTEDPDERLRDATIAFRILHERAKQKESEEREEENALMDEMIKNSPHYDKTPGNHSPIKPLSLAEAEKEVENEISRFKEELIKDGRYKEDEFSYWAAGKRRDFELVKMMRETLAERGEQLRGEVDKLRKEAGETMAAGDGTTAFNLMGAADRKQSELNKLEANSATPPISLGSIYQQQGFNAKPEMVRRVEDLEKREDILRDEQGKPLIGFRGLSHSKYAEEFRSGDQHFPGKGINGNGSYSALQPPSRDTERYGDPYESSRKEAKAYGDITDKRSVVAFAVRKDARIADFSQNESAQETYNRKKAIIEEARTTTGMRFHDVGEAAAAMGYDGMMVSAYSDRKHFVFFNRGAVIVAAEGGMEP
jgi:hypothetical protein